MIVVTTPRALLDWYLVARRGAKKRQPDSSEEQKAVPLPGVTGMTRFRLQFRMQARIAAKVVELCDEALADETLHDSKRNAIEVTRKQIVDAIAAENGDEI